MTQTLRKRSDSALRISVLSIQADTVWPYAASMDRAKVLLFP
jgi:hypothetical protein